MKFTRPSGFIDEDDKILNLDKEMKSTIIGRLKKMLVIETFDGNEVVYPKGTIVEVSSEKDYPHEYGVDGVGEAFDYVNRDKGMPNLLTGEIEDE